MGEKSGMSKQDQDLIQGAAIYLEVQVLAEQVHQQEGVLLEELMTLKNLGLMLVIMKYRGEEVSLIGQAPFLHTESCQGLLMLEG